MSASELKRLIESAHGAREVDILFTNASLVDVFAMRVVEGALAVADGMIVGVDFGSGSLDSCAARKVVDCRGCFLAPGFIDAHLHIESSSVRPSEYMKEALAHGTTTAIADPHEIVNVCGLEGFRFMVEDARRAPGTVSFMMPSCVPALPDEQAGACVTADDMRAYIAEHEGDVFGLGEMMNFPGVIGADEETLARIDVASSTASGLVDGHAPLVFGRDLDAYAASGIIADHECTKVDEALEKLSRGMYIMLREGTCSHDLEALAPLIVEDPLRARRCCFATDDRAPADMKAEGFIDNACRLAVMAGIDPLVALSMATLSAAECLGLDHGRIPASRACGALAPGRRADIVMLDGLSFSRPPMRVYAGGELVAENGVFVGRVEDPSDEVISLEKTLTDSVKLPHLDDEVFSYDFISGQAVIDVIPGNVVTRCARPEDAAGLRRVAVVERHGRARRLQDEGCDGSLFAGSGLVGVHVGRGWVRGFPLERGALASSVGHDSHNICVIGDNPSDMRMAVEAVGQGGFVLVRNGRVVSRVDLPLGGLMSDSSVEEVACEHAAFRETARSFGIEGDLDPLMGLVFLPLPVIPAVRIRPEGLFDVTTFSYID